MHILENQHCIMAEGGRNLRIKPFTVDEDHIATGEKWADWLEKLEREMRFSVSAMQLTRKMQCSSMEAQKYGD